MATIRTTPVMPMGKLKGQPLDEMTTPYLMWLLSQDAIRFKYRRLVPLGRSLNSMPIMRSARICVSRRFAWVNSTSSSGVRNMVRYAVAALAATRLGRCTLHAAL